MTKNNYIPSKLASINITKNDQIETNTTKPNTTQTIKRGQK